MNPVSRVQDGPLRQTDEATSHSTWLPKNDSQVAGYQNRLCVGLTGGIGCGKSTVANLFAAHGAAIIDTDEIAHRLTQPDGLAISPIRAAFGDDCITGDGALNRTKMRQLVFSDASAKHRLERILHPLILEQTQAKLQQTHHAPYIIVVVPLLLDSPAFLQLVQRVLVVDCAEDSQVLRVTRRSRLSGDEVRAIMAQQPDRTKRLTSADDVIQNDADFGGLEKQVTALHNSYLNMNWQNSN